MRSNLQPIDLPTTAESAPRHRWVNQRAMALLVTDLRNAKLGISIY